jgi:hypothetical protein
MTTPKVGSSAIDGIKIYFAFSVQYIALKLSE